MINKDNNIAFNKLAALQSYLNKHGLKKEAMNISSILYLLLAGGCSNEVVSSAEACFVPANTVEYKFVKGDNIYKVIRKKYPEIYRVDKEFEEEYKESMVEHLKDYIVEINEKYFKELQNISWFDSLLGEEVDLTNLPNHIVIQVPDPMEVRVRYVQYKTYLIKRDSGLLGDSSDISEEDISFEEEDSASNRDGRNDIDDLIYSLGAEKRLKIAEGLPGSKGKHASKLYKDSRGYWTIGWGHCTSCRNETRKFQGRSIKESEAQSILDKDIEEVEMAVKKMLKIKQTDIKIRLTQSEYDTFINLGFNGGTGKSSIVKRVIDKSKIDKADYGSISNAIGQFGDPDLTSPGLHARRIEDIINSRIIDADEEVGVTHVEISNVVQQHGWSLGGRGYRAGGWERSSDLRKEIAAREDVVDLKSFEEFIMNSSYFCKTNCV